MYRFTKEQNNLVKEIIIYNGEAREQKNPHYLWLYRGSPTKYTRIAN